MTTITVQRLLNHPSETIWAALADIGGIHRFHPLVDRSPLAPGSADTGVGAQRTCHFTDGNHVEERVVVFDVGQQIDIEIVAGSMPLSSARASFRIEPRGSDATHVEMTMDYTPKFGWLGRAMDALMIKRRFGVVMARVVEGLDAHLTTGKEIGTDWTRSRAA